MQPTKEIKETFFYTIQEIADELGVSTTTIHLIEEQAFKKIRRELWRRNIDISDLL
jgi:DNA-directed RNA polymerase specialized sigma24 family protein